MMVTHGTEGGDSGGMSETDKTSPHGKRICLQWNGLSSTDCGEDPFF